MSKNRVFMNMDDIGLCNCAACGAECVGEKTLAKLSEIPSIFWPARVRRMPSVDDRLNGRPICSSCVALEKARQARLPAPLPVPQDFS